MFTTKWVLTDNHGLKGSDKNWLGGHSFREISGLNQMHL